MAELFMHLTRDSKAILFDCYSFYVDTMSKLSSRLNDTIWVQWRDNRECILRQQGNTATKMRKWDFSCQEVGNELVLVCLRLQRSANESRWPKHTARCQSSVLSVTLVFSSKIMTQNIKLQEKKQQKHLHLLFLNGIPLA